MQQTRGRHVLVPFVAAALALAYPAAVAADPRALAGVTVAAAVAACALVLARRRSPGLRVALVAIAAWLALGLAGAFLLRGHAVRGLAWVLVVLYLVPLPLIPWLYAITFETQPHEGRGKKENGRVKTEDGDGQGLSSSLYRLPSTRKGGGP